MKYKYLLVLILSAHCAMAHDYVFINAVPDTLRFHNASPYSYTLDVDVNNDGVGDITLVTQDVGSGTLEIFGQSDNSTSGWTIEVDQLYPAGSQQALPYTCGATVNTGGGFATHGDMTLFKGHGARYISVRKLLAGGWYNYGWIKVDVSPSGGTMIIYATGYNDDQGTTSDTYHRTGLNECVATGIDETSAAELKMYNNANQLYVTGQPTAEINVYDLTGKVVTGFNYAGQRTSYDLRLLSAGCYLVEAISGDTRKVIRIIVE